MSFMYGPLWMAEQQLHDVRVSSLCGDIEGGSWVLVTSGWRSLVIAGQLVDVDVRVAQKDFNNLSVALRAHSHITYDVRTEGGG